MAGRASFILALVIGLSHAWVAASSARLQYTDEVNLLQTAVDSVSQYRLGLPPSFDEDPVNLFQRQQSDLHSPVADAAAAETMIPSFSLGQVIFEEMEKAWATYTGKSAKLPNEAMSKAQPVHDGEKWAEIVPDSHVLADGDEGLAFFTSASAREWMILGATCVIFFLLDNFFIQKFPSTFYYHACALVLWLLLALIFNGYIALHKGSQKAILWTSGYLLEWMLSMDNLLVFHIIFKAYKTPPSHVHKAVFVGIFGAIAMRMVFFMVLSTMLYCMHWVRIPFGCLLIWSGVEAARSEDDEDDDVQDMKIVRALRWLLGDRLVDDYGKMPTLILTDGRVIQVSLLFVVVVCLEASDLIFAVDSVSAKVAQIPDQYISFSSSVIAMFGLRALFFIITDLVDMFELLKYGLCLVLVFIGSELIFGISLEPASACLLIASVFVVSIIGSVTMQRMKVITEPEPESN